MTLQSLPWAMIHPVAVSKSWTFRPRTYEYNATSNTVDSLEQGHTDVLMSAISTEGRLPKISESTANKCIASSLVSTSESSTRIKSGGQCTYQGNSCDESSLAIR